MFSYLKVNMVERDTILNILVSYIDDDKSKIVKVCAMQTLADLAGRDSDIRSPVIRKLETAMKAGSPAVKVRGRKLIDLLK